MLFYRLHTDGTQEDCSWLADSYAGSLSSHAWLIGGGPSLGNLDCATVNKSPACKMAVNFCGRGPDGSGLLIKPTHWTTFDPSARFHRSIFMDASIMKFLLGGRKMDLLPGTWVKMCDAPNTYFIDHEYRGYRDFLSRSSDKILHQRDSFIQAMDIMFRLGFRTLYLVGTELIIRPSPEQIRVAIEHGVRYEGGCTGIPHSKDKDQTVWSDMLSDFLEQCVLKRVGRTRQETIAKLIEVDRETQYSFTETKTFQAAVNTDGHYWSTVQYLRNAMKCIRLHGLNLVSCTPGSRLNYFLPYVSIQDAAGDIAEQVGDPVAETIEGRFSGQHEAPGEGLPAMKDIPPYGWKALQDAKQQDKAIEVPVNGNDPRLGILDRFKALQRQGVGEEG